MLRVVQHFINCIINPFSANPHARRAFILVCFLCSHVNIPVASPMSVCGKGYICMAVSSKNSY